MSDIVFNSPGFTNRTVMSIRSTGEIILNDEFPQCDRVKAFVKLAEDLLRENVHSELGKMYLELRNLKTAFKESNFRMHEAMDKQAIVTRQRDAANERVKGLEAIADAHCKKAVELKDKLERAQKFKAYVHDRLDRAGVPKEFLDQHAKNGCRIGGRLDWVLGYVPKSCVSHIVFIDSTQKTEPFIFKSGNGGGGPIQISDTTESTKETSSCKRFQKFKTIGESTLERLQAVVSYLVREEGWALHGAKDELKFQQPIGTLHVQVLTRYEEMP